MVIFLLAALSLPPSLPQFQPEIVNEVTIDDSREVELLAKCVDAEARNQSELGKRLVIDVVLNRVDSPTFPDSIEEVILQDGQFSPYIHRKEVNSETIQLIREEQEQRTNDKVVWFKTKSYHNHGVPITKEDDHYFSGEAKG